MPAAIPTMHLKKGQGTPRKVARFWAGKKTQRDLEDIRTLYADQLKIGKQPSTSLIVRRSLGLLASHLRDVQEQNEVDHETAVLMRHQGN